MSETDNKTKYKAEIKTTETAPYMKKDKQQNNPTETPKSITPAPLVLLLVTVIIIAATFYENEYKVAHADLMTDSFGSTANTDVTTNKETVFAELDSEKTAAEPEPAAVKQTAATTDKQAKVSEVRSQAVKTTAIEVNKAAESASDQIPGESRNAPSQRQAYEQARKEAKARMLERREKHHKEMQQRRQAYKKEMQAKREQYEATIKTYQEKRAEIAEKQKAIYQQIEQNRIETIQKIKQMHKEISDMQKQMHQMMRESQPQVKNNATKPKQGS